MPGGRLVHQQQARRAGERERQLDALGVAVGERRAALVGEAASSARARAARRPRRASAARRAPAMRAACAPACASSASSTFSRTVIDANVAATWNVRPTPRRAIARGGRPSMRAPASRTVPGVGRELAVDEVEAGRLAGAVRPDQRDDLAGGDRERHVVARRRTPPKALVRPLDLQHGGRRATTLGCALRYALGAAVALMPTRAARAAARRRCPSETRAR